MNYHRIRQIEWATAALLSATVLFLLIVRATHAGGLWRDEAECVQMARLPRLTDVVANLPYSSFPLPFVLVVRVYTMFFGAGAVSLRCFGFLIGISFLGAAWFHSRSLTRDVAFLVPVLIGLNANFFTIGTWVRGYGIGSLLAVLAFILTARLLLKPSKSRLLAASLAYLGSMECLFLNGAIVPAIVLAGAAVFWVRGDLKWLGLLLFAAGLCGGIAYLTYLLNTYGTGDWAHILEVPFSLTPFLDQFLAACGGTSLTVSVIWLALVPLAVIGAVWRLSNIWKNPDRPDRDLLLFGLMAIFASILFYYVLLRRVHNEPEARYFLALVCLLAVATDLSIANLCHYYWVRLARVGLVIVALVVLPVAIWPQITERQTNVDIVAQKLEQQASGQDFILVRPQSLGVSFNWYYHGATPWLTIPPISEHRTHRYDLLREKMREATPLREVFLAVRQTLGSGNRVWVVGGVRWPEEKDDVPFWLPPAPDPVVGWSAAAYGEVWSLQLGDFLTRHAKVNDVAIWPGNNVSPIESAPLLVFQGWRD